jgi:anthranilate synthase component 1
MAEAFADLETPFSLYLKLAHSKGRRPVQLPARVRGGWRALRPLQLHRPAGAHAAAREWLRRRRRSPKWCATAMVVETVRHAEAGSRQDAAGLHRRGLPETLQGGAAPGPAALLRRPGGLLRLRHGAATSRRSSCKTCPPDTLGCPDIVLLQCEELAVIDNLSGKLYLIVYADPAQPEAYSQRQEAAARTEGPAEVFGERSGGEGQPRAFRSSASSAKPDYLAAVERAKDLIAGGDFMQVQVGQRLQASAMPRARCRCTVRCVRSTPAPTCTTTTSPGTARAGISTWWAPRRRSWSARRHTAEGQKITIRPLAGTRPRGATPELDKAVEQELVWRPQGARRARDADRPGAQRHRAHREDRLV